MTLCECSVYRYTVKYFIKSDWLRAITQCKNEEIYRNANISENGALWLANKQLKLPIRCRNSRAILTWYERAVSSVSWVAVINRFHQFWLVNFSFYYYGVILRQLLFNWNVVALVCFSTSLNCTGPKFSKISCKLIPNWTWSSMITYILIGHSLDQLKVLQVMMGIRFGGPKIGGDRSSRMMVFSINQKRKKVSVAEC